MDGIKTTVGLKDGGTSEVCCMHDALEQFEKWRHTIVLNAILILR